MGKRRFEPLTEEEKAWIRDHHREIGSEMMARTMEEVFGHPFGIGMLKAFRRREGLRAEVSGRFPEGHVPWSKGRTMEEICRTPEALERTRATRFRKGNTPWDRVPVGSETVRDGYVYVKVSDTPCGYQWDNWRAKHRMVWEEAHGPVPEGMQVCFLDGDRGNCALDNLVLLSNAERAAFRPFASPHREVAKLGVAIARLKGRCADV